MAYRRVLLSHLSRSRHSCSSSLSPHHVSAPSIALGLFQSRLFSSPTDLGSGLDLGQEMIGATAASHDLLTRHVISLLDSYHDLTGLPWWVVIATSTVAFRTALLPILILQRKQTKAISHFLPKLPPFWPPKGSGRSVVEQLMLFRTERKALVCPSFFWIPAYFSIQISCFFLWITSIRRMSLDHHPGFDTGGALWFQNLTEIPNGLYGPLFPFLIAGLHYTNTQTAFSASSVHKVDKFVQLAKTYKIFLNFLTFALYFLAFQMPQGSLLYWSTNLSFSIAQQSIIKHPVVSAKLGLQGDDTVQKEAGNPIQTNTQKPNSAAMAPSVQGEWIKVEQKGGQTPGPRSSHGIAVVGDKLYSFGGELTPNISIDKDLYVFDFNTHTWSIAPSNGRAPDIKALGTRMVSVGTKLYLFGGRDEKKQFDDFYSYDTVTNEWKFLTKLDEEGGPEARTYHSMASDENHVYVFGGVSKGGTDKTPFRFRTIEAYNIADGKWAQLPDPGEQFPRFERRGGAGFVVVQGKIWVVYGFATSPDPNGKNDYESDQVQFYDPATQKWTEVETKGDKPSARSVFAHAVVGKYILIFGGETWPDPKAHLGPGTLSDEGFALDTETLVWERFGGGAEPGQLGWPGYTTATVYGKKGLLMHGGKRPTNNRTDELYFYAVNSA